MHTSYLETISPKVNGSLTRHYESYLRLRECNHTKIDEHFVQRLWFEQAYLPTLETTEGETIQIVQTGFWNHRAGPDFLRVMLVNGEGEIETGDVEIHLNPMGWHQHRHDLDKTYSDTILHVVWENSPRSFYPKTSRHHPIRQIVLSTQLRLPLEELQKAFAGDSPSASPVAKPGSCHEIMKQWPPEKIEEFLREAGWYRFHRKQALWRTRAHLLGEKQALWIGISEALGYSENKAPFRHLAQSLPIVPLLREKKDDIEALIFGISGFLPRERLAQNNPRAATYQRKLWNTWWSRRSELAGKLMPEKFWKTGGMRPANRPERKLGALSLISRNFHSFHASASQENPEKIHDWLIELRHELWSDHYNFTSASPTPLALVGTSRAQAILYNVILPIRSHLEDTSRRWLENAKSHTSNLHSRLAVARLFDNRIPGECYRSLLAQEGLVQIYLDFCGSQGNGCKNCPLPEKMEFSSKRFLPLG